MYTIIISKLFYYGNFTGVSSSIFKKTNVQGIYGTIEINIHCNSADFYVDDKYITIIKCNINITREEGNSCLDFKTLLSNRDLQVLNSDEEELSEENILKLKFPINKQASTTHRFAITDIKELGSVKVESREKVTAHYKNGNNVTKIGTISNNFL